MKSRESRVVVVPAAAEGGRPPVYVAAVTAERGGGDKGEGGEGNTKMVIQSTFKFLPFLRDNKVGARRDDGSPGPVCPSCLPFLVREHDYRQRKHRHYKHCQHQHCARDEMGGVRNRGAGVNRG